MFPGPSYSRASALPLHGQEEILPFEHRFGDGWGGFGGEHELINDSFTSYQHSTNLAALLSLQLSAACDLGTREQLQPAAFLTVPAFGDVLCGGPPLVPFGEAASIQVAGDDAPGYIPQQGIQRLQQQQDYDLGPVGDETVFNTLGSFQHDFTQQNLGSLFGQTVSEGHVPVQDPWLVQMPEDDQTSSQQAVLGPGEEWHTDININLVGGAEDDTPDFSGFLDFPCQSSANPSPVPTSPATGLGSGGSLSQATSWCGSSPMTNSAQNPPDPSHISPVTDKTQAKQR